MPVTASHLKLCFTFWVTLVVIRVLTTRWKKIAFTQVSNCNLLTLNLNICDKHWYPYLQMLLGEIFWKWQFQVFKTSCLCWWVNSLFYFWESLCKFNLHNYTAGANSLPIQWHSFSVPVSLNVRKGCILSQRAKGKETERNFTWVYMLRFVSF